MKETSARRGIAVLFFTLTLLALNFIVGPFIWGAANASQIPPRFVPGTFLYVNNHLTNVLLGKTLFLTQKDCMEDVQRSVAKAVAVENGKIVGFCLPVPTLSLDDLKAPVAGERGSI